MVKQVDNEPPFAAELRNMAVAPSHQHQGIGRRLVTEVTAHLRRHELRSMLVRVLAANPNTGFYQKLGATPVRRELYDWNGVPLIMLVYGWADLERFQS
jgi:ribosomal protein S18 acetylase RimI-like enzyme